MPDANALRAARQRLETETGYGVASLPAARTAAPATGRAGSKAERLAELQRRYKDCMSCALGSRRTNLVFGSGDPDARLMFVGEAPGQDEDEQGLPFVGAAGQLLTKIIEAMKLTRQSVYIANTLKCRPPNNRAPLPEEQSACSPILEAQIDIIQPCVICALGKSAAQALLGTTEPIGRLRGRFHDRRGIKLMPTFHPAYLLRNPGDKKLVWQDCQTIMRELGLL